MSDKPMTKTKKLDPAVTDLENFSREIFGLELYPWQIAAMKGITGKGGRDVSCGFTAANARETGFTGRIKSHSMISIFF